MASDLLELVTGDCELTCGGHVCLPVPPPLTRPPWQPASPWASLTPAPQKLREEQGF